MTKRIETWIQTVNPEDENRIASPEWIVDLLGLSGVKAQLSKLTHKVHDLEYPRRRNFILESLKAKPHSIYWFELHIHDYDFWDLKRLEREGEIEFFRSGTQRMYRLSEFKENAQKGGLNEE